MKKVDLVIIIPVGPTTDLDFLLDTIESVKFFCSKSQKIILTNDSHSTIALNTNSLGIDVVEMEKPMGKQSGLYFSLCKGITHALESYDFKVLLRMDDDALITGPNPDKEALDFFNIHSSVGLIGSYKVDWKGQARSFDPPKKQIQIETSIIWRVFNFCRGRKTNSISPILKLAQKNQYELGEHVLGGVYFMSRKLLDNMINNNLLPAQQFLGSKLEEDHIFGIVTYAVNMRLADFVTGSYPMCLKWKGMPASPNEVLKMRKKVIHSTRYYGDLNEKEIRKIFKTARNKWR